MLYGEDLVTRLIPVHGVLAVGEPDGLDSKAWGCLLAVVLWGDVSEKLLIGLIAGCNVLRLVNPSRWLIFLFDVLGVYHTEGVFHLAR